MRNDLLERQQYSREKLELKIKNFNWAKEIYKPKMIGLLGCSKQTKNVCMATENFSKLIGETRGREERENVVGVLTLLANELRNK